MTEEHIDTSIYFYECVGEWHHPTRSYTPTPDNPIYDGLEEYQWTWYDYQYNKVDKPKGNKVLLHEYVYFDTGREEPKICQEYKLIRDCDKGTYYEN